MSSTMAPPLPPALPPEPVTRLSVKQYHAMIDAGVVTDDDLIELLEGWLVPKMPKNPGHRIATRHLRKALEKLLPAGWEVESQEPITTTDSEPEPDVGVAREGAFDNKERHPNATETGLIIEIADSTLARDRGMKKRIYARAAVPVYWIVNLPDRCIEVYTNPTGPAEKPDYRHQQIYGANDVVPILLDGAEIGQLEVKAVLP